MAVYKCRGRERTDDETGKSVCDYESPAIWRGRCPKCGGPYTPERFGAERSNRKAVTAAMSTDPGIAHKYIPTHIEAFDDVIGGGVVESQAILLAGQAGSRKSSLALLIANGLTKETTRPLLFVSAEQNNNDVLGLCRLLKVENEQIKIHGNTTNLQDILALCDEYRPLMAVFDSLQAISEGSGVNNEGVAKEITKYGKRTKMVSIIVSHLTRDLGIKGGTGAPHYVDTICMYEPYVPAMDGDPREMFGRDVAREIGFDGEMQDALPAVRVLVGGAFGKHRYGNINQKAYVWTGPDGELRWLKKKSKILAFKS